MWYPSLKQQAHKHTVESRPPTPLTALHSLKHAAASHHKPAHRHYCDLGFQANLVPDGSDAERKCLDRCLSTPPASPVRASEHASRTRRRTSETSEPYATAPSKIPRRSGLPEDSSWSNMSANSQPAQEAVIAAGSAACTSRLYLQAEYLVCSQQRMSSTLVCTAATGTPIPRLRPWDASALALNMHSQRDRPPPPLTSHACRRPLDKQSNGPDSSAPSPSPAPGLLAAPPLQSPTLSRWQSSLTRSMPQAPGSPQAALTHATSPAHSPAEGRPQPGHPGSPLASLSPLGPSQQDPGAAPGSTSLRPPAATGGLVSDSAPSTSSAAQSSRPGQRRPAAGREPAEPQAGPPSLGAEGSRGGGSKASPRGAPQAEQHGQLDAGALEASLAAAQQRLQASQGSSGIGRRSLAAGSAQHGSLGEQGHTQVRGPLPPSCCNSRITRTASWLGPLPPALLPLGHGQALRRGSDSKLAEALLPAAPSPPVQQSGGSGQGDLQVSALERPPANASPAAEQVRERDPDAASGAAGASCPLGSTAELQARRC